jgi:ATPase family protein associated with various cellular activities (AAA)
MNPLDRPPEVAAAAFIEMARTPAQHLRLALFGVIGRVIESCTDGDIGAAIDTHPFLADYLEEMQSQSYMHDALARRWWESVDLWVRDAIAAGVFLPLVALREAGLTPLELELLLAVGLVEEDPRFGSVFERSQRNDRRPTFGLLMAWWRETDDGDDDRCDAVRAGLQHLLDHGLVQLANPDVPRADWALSVSLPVWDVLRGEAPSQRWLRYVRRTDLRGLDDYVAAESLRASCGALPALLARRPAPVLLVRGPSRNGRKTLAAALAHALGRPMLLLREPPFEDEARWRLLGALSAMTNAVPVLEADLAPGESRVLPSLPLTNAPVIVVTGRHGAWSCADARPSLAIDLPLPDETERVRHWRASLPKAAYASLPESATRMRLTSGGIRAVAAAATGFASLAGRETLEADDLRHACRTLQAARLETLATRLNVRGALDDLAVDSATREELDALVARCRWREQLAASCGSSCEGGVGVRALFGGPSGSGKTLAARLLAAELGKDLYRVDLAATVNKYLGETEKSLDRALNAAEELDIVLLLDEGDALMAGRTDVGSSNDRYANLETNFLLQRIESFEGIIVVTTNAADRIDGAFARRMDVVVNFRSPDAWRRLEILKLHLAADAVDAAWLEDAATRCALSGGQLRNVVTHARLLSLRSGEPLNEGHLQAALAREYRKTGGTCPLRPAQPRPCPQ